MLGLSVGADVGMGSTPRSTPFLPRCAPCRASWEFSPCSLLWPSPLALQALGRGATRWGLAIPVALLPGGPFSALFWAVCGGRRLCFCAPLFSSYLSPSLLSLCFFVPVLTSAWPQPCPDAPLCILYSFLGLHLSLSPCIVAGLSLPLSLLKAS